MAFVNDEHDNRVAVILCREYEQRKEDLHDLAVVAERRKEPTIEFGEIKKQYKQSTTPG